MLHSHTSYTSETSQTSYSSSNRVQSSESQASLIIHVSSATELVSRQTFGKQDPFLQFYLDAKNKDSYLKTFTHKNAGENATWNQKFTISLNGEPNLYVEVLDEENTVNEVIGFAAIPINQVVHADGAYMNGLFQIYDVKGERAGLLNLQLAATGFPNSRTPDFGQAVQGTSFVEEEHCARMKSSKKKSTGVAVGGAIFGGALAVGAGLLGKKLYGEHQEDKLEQEAEAAESQRLAEEEETRKREEQEKYQREREEFEREKSEFESQKQHRSEEQQQEHHEVEGHRRRNSGSSSSDDDNDAKKWNPVGTYAPGDRVKYHNQIYMCLQGHTSNPTWQPGAAHSLWQAE
ncbi:uncharacterized protein EV154DRAFT_98544 [Mucor mucedo]|uniref:uncharacterized protein n=1 Tax=Mucor mucedo TaxID=29922 RepID=UPI00221EE555|nr:uncharacterized protein EV154DRAFT_98544 [Mucor mucedo]KAI7894315.1 hypothetical protein EV154DRAFT_98544 [Mucor mucedo]